MFKRGQLKVEWFASDTENDTKFRIFWPTVNIRGGVNKISTNCWRFTYDQTSEIHLMAIHCATAEHGVLMKKMKKKKKVHG